MANVVVLAGSAALSGERNSITSTGWVIGTATAGVAVPNSGRGDVAHLIVDKNATITVGIYGYLPGYGNWVKCDSIALAATNVAEAVAVRSVASFTRVQSTVEAIGASGAANFFWAFTGE
jgi:hypothetical protein